MVSEAEGVQDGQNALPQAEEMMWGGTSSAVVWQTMASFKRFCRSWFWHLISLWKGLRRERGMVYLDRRIPAMWCVFRNLFLQLRTLAHVHIPTTVRGHIMLLWQRSLCCYVVVLLILGLGYPLSGRPDSMKNPLAKVENKQLCHCYI